MSDITLEALDKVTFRNKKEYDDWRESQAEEDWMLSSLAETTPASYPCVAVGQPVIYNNETGTAKLEIIFVYKSDFE